VFEPTVDAEHCTGCGMCEKSCPTERAAIRVLRPEFVQGRIGAHYRMQDKAAAGADAAPAVVPTPSPAAAPTDAAGEAPRSPSAPGVDYLNRGGPL
jgi:ferredoxin-type protein NapG